MKTILLPRVLATFLSLLLLWSCATTPDQSAIIPASDLPADVTMNKDAGRGHWLIVPLRLESEELPFIVDTGSPYTLFSESLEPKLGKRLGAGPSMTGFGVRFESFRHTAPKLYLGNTPLITGSNIFTGSDFKRLSVGANRSIMGILGMDFQKLLRSYGSCLVAYSGGVDAAFLAFVAHPVLGDKSLAVLAGSPSLPRRELEKAVAVARQSNGSN